MSKPMTAIAVFNPGQSRLEFFAKKGSAEALLMTFNYGRKRQEIEDFVNTLIDDHGMEVENMSAIMEDDRYDSQFV